MNHFINICDNGLSWMIQAVIQIGQETGLDRQRIIELPMEKCGLGREEAEKALIVFMP